MALLIFTVLTWVYVLLSIVAVPLSFVISMLVTSLTGGELAQSQASSLTFVAFVFSVINASMIAPAVVCAWVMVLFAYAVIYAIIYLPKIMDNQAEYQFRQLLARLDSETATERFYAARECGIRGLLQTEDKLTSMVLTDPDLDVRLAAYDALERMGLPKMRVILNALDNAPDKGYKINLIRLLGKLTNNRQVIVLKDHYLKDSDAGVRLAILDAFDGFVPADTIDLLLEMMDATEDKPLKLKLLAILHKYDHILSVEPLLKLLKAETDKDVKLAIYSILGDIKDVRSNDVFFQALNDSDPDIRNMAAETLKRLGVKFTARNVIKETVKVPCKYCGTLVDVASSNCASCGAPFQR